MTGTPATASGPASAVHRSPLPGPQALALAATRRQGGHLVVRAETATRCVAALATLPGQEFALLTPLPGGTVLHTCGPGGLLGQELTAIVPAVQELVGDPAKQPIATPPARDTLRLAPGDLLALGELVRLGDPRRIDVACEDLRISELPWWVADFAWGPLARIDLLLYAGTELRVHCPVHLLSRGWGVLHADDRDDIGFAPMTDAQVQARIGTLCRLLGEAGDA